MKSWKNLKMLGLALIMAMMSGCGKDDKDDDPTQDDVTITKKYYIKSKIDAEWKLNQTGAKNWCQVGNGLCYSNINGGFFDEVSIFILKENHHFTEGNIPSLIGDTISFDQDEDYYAYFSWGENGKIWSSLNTNASQKDSYLYIQNVEEDGSHSGYKCFKVTGTFKCMVGDLDQTITKPLTEGVFSIRVSEEDV
ncbi:hypothetical protein Oweho_2785 [Owenweeksia hongkongensis DSM 17368]|uniref:Lipocalin-like domain-containing protein n=1 Tax=Owenweeksia hongkongensis (strain DSM 17368 / CIP 108786 / JCM 12287 / NRRL B-23963 / UST20020801) TaxID=926562 RepID=G8R081_OWEHD|nr:hypothetical protein [Owenweeksia hongkongensis]AEV33747.1 hypothetical protein Oweho_2785 [Owenweeksia hongkongensis DSM 17368]